MYYPTTRLLAVLELLQSKAQISGSEIARRLEVSSRSVRRYIVMLQDMGIPIETERGRYGAYRLISGFKMPPMMFTDNEALTVALGLLLIRQMGLATPISVAESTFAKFTRVMPEPIQKEVQALHEAVTFHIPTPDVEPNGAAIRTLSTAVQNCQRVKIHYESWQQATTERIVDPYGLLYYGGYWYMVGYCHLRQDTRTFRLDRIQQLALTTTMFERPLHFDTFDQVMRSLAQTPGTYDVEVHLKTTLSDAQRVIAPSLGILTEYGDGVLFQCYVQRLGWLAHFLLGLEFDLVIRKPEKLRDVMRRLAAKANQLANQA
jgi:predicted DNA-binding transcriptional regulator YafY